MFSYANERNIGVGISSQICKSEPLNPRKPLTLFATRLSSLVQPSLERAGNHVAENMELKRSKDSLLVMPVSFDCCRRSWQTI